MTALPTFPLLYRSQPIDEADHQRPEQGIGDIQIGVGRSPAIGEIVEDFITRLGQDDTQKGYEAAIRPACHEPSNQENDEPAVDRSEEHTSELQSLMRISNAVFCLTKQTIKQN